MKLNFIQIIVWILNNRYFKDSKIELYIKVDDDKNWLQHPNPQINLRMIYPYHIFYFGPPKNWIEFERVQPPELDVYEKFDSSIGADISDAFNHNGLEYKLVDGKYKDVWYVLQMTEEEKIEKQEYVKNQFYSTLNFKSWIFNEENCYFLPPVDLVIEEGAEEYQYDWCEEDQKWNRIIIDDKWTGLMGSSPFYKDVIKSLQEGKKSWVAGRQITK